MNCLNYLKIEPTFRKDSSTINKSAPKSLNFSIFIVENLTSKGGLVENRLIFGTPLGDSRLPAGSWVVLTFRSRHNFCLSTHFYYF